MSIEDAKNFYLHYYGSEFMMCREDEKKWIEFKKMRISKDTREKWRQEIIDKLFKRIISEADNRWAYFDTLIDVLNKSISKKEENCYKLLKLMSKLDCLTEMEAIIITETMAGRSADYSKGVVKFICENSNLIGDFEAVICKIDRISSIGEAHNNTKIEPNTRKCIALTSFEKAVKKYSEANKRCRK